MALDAPFAGYTLVSRLTSVSDGVERWRAEGRSGTGEVYVGPRDLVLRATNLPVWGPFSRIESGTRSDRWYVVVPGRIEENLEQLASRLTPGACLALAWHIAAALAEVHEHGGAHGALHPQHIGLDPRGSLTIRPALAASQQTDPDPDASAQASDCFQFAAILDTLDVAEAGDPALALLMNGLSRERSRLRMQPARAIRQTLTAILQRHPAWTDRLVEELGPAWKPGPLPRAPMQDRPVAPRHPWRQSAAVAAVPVAAAVPAGDRVEEGPQPAVINLGGPAEDTAPAAVAARAAAPVSGPQIRLPASSAAAVGGPTSNEDSSGEDATPPAAAAAAAVLSIGTPATAGGAGTAAETVAPSGETEEDNATAAGADPAAPTPTDTPSGDDDGDDNNNAAMPDANPTAEATPAVHAVAEDPAEDETADAPALSVALAAAVPVQVMLDEAPPSGATPAQDEPAHPDDDAPTQSLDAGSLASTIAEADEDTEASDDGDDNASRDAAIDDDAPKAEDDSDDVDDDDTPKAEDDNDDVDDDDTPKAEDDSDDVDDDDTPKAEDDNDDDPAPVDPEAAAESDPTPEEDSLEPAAAEGGDSATGEEPDGEPGDGEASEASEASEANETSEAEPGDDDALGVPLLVAMPSIMPSAASGEATADPPAPQGPPAVAIAAVTPTPGSPPTVSAFDEPDEPSVRLAVGASDAPRWQGVGGVTGDQRREQELGAGKWSEPVEGNLDGLRKQVSNNPMRELEFEATGPNWVALGGVAALVLLLGGWWIFASVGGSSDAPPAPARATVTAPSGSTISLDGTAFGTAPAQVPVPADTAAHQLCATPPTGEPRCASVRATDLASGSYRLD